MQHGKNLSAEEDPGRSLSEEGAREVKDITEIVARHWGTVAVIRHSGRDRARQTAELLARNLNPDRGSAETYGLSPDADVIAIANKGAVDSSVMLVDHLPFMVRRVGCLVAEDMNKTVIKCRNAGVVCLGQAAETPAWFIKWASLPAIR